MNKWESIELIIGALLLIIYLYKKYKKNKSKKEVKLNHTRYGITKEQLERLADYEQEKNKKLSRYEAKEWALERLENDNK